MNQAPGNSTNSSQEGPESSEIHKSKREIRQMPSLLSQAPGNGTNSSEEGPELSEIHKSNSELPSFLSNAKNFISRSFHHQYTYADSSDDSDSVDSDSDVDTSSSECSTTSVDYSNFRQRLMAAALMSAFVVLIIAIESDENETRSKKRKCWVRPLFQMRMNYGFYYTNFRLLKHDPEMFHRYIRMSLDQFNILLEMVKPFITKQDVVRKSIPAEERMLLTLRYLASENDHESLSFSYNISVSAIQRIIPEVCSAIWDHLKPIVLKPCDENDWRNIEKDFAETCYFPHCVGSIDGRHVNIKAPRGAGSQYFNYKHRHSVHLLAIADSKYIFRVVDIGALGRQSDRGFFIRSSFYAFLERNKFNLPQKERITESGPSLPYVFVGDSAFSLSPYLLFPFPKKNISYHHRWYNYRHTYARRIVENSFGILTAQWRILRTTIECQPETVNKIIEACVCLHNYLRFEDVEHGKSTYIDSAGIDFSTWNLDKGDDSTFENGNDPAEPSPHSQPTDCITRQSNEEIREAFSEYFNNEGKLDWVDKYL